ncbi:hypothetical protein FRC09_011204 [Ceratobasidium sp. 395]|nr:hypothetical protein FRC09_011204 [Ceratobasidium sp. 395]
MADEKVENAAATASVDHTLQGHDPEKAPETIKDQTDVPQDGYLTGAKLALAFIGMILSLLLVALDQTIVATALPQIASYFDALCRAPASLWFVPITLPAKQLLIVAPTKWIYVAAVLYVSPRQMLLLPI